MAQHFIELCQGCGTVINQCRCPGPKETRYGICSNCARKGATATNKPTEDYINAGTSTIYTYPTSPHEWMSVKELEERDAEIEELASKYEVLLLRANDVAAENHRLAEENETLTDALRQIRTWADAYPLAIFPEPNWTKAAAVLKDNSMTLDAISASNMRHVLDGVMRIVDGALKETPMNDGAIGGGWGFDGWPGGRGCSLKASSSETLQRR